MLFAVKAKKADYSRAILDIGLNRATPGARVFAALKGAVEAGLDVPHGEKILPSDERVKGAILLHITKMPGILYNCRTGGRRHKKGAGVNGI